MNILIVISYYFLIALFVVFSYLFIDQNFFYLKDLYTGFAFSNRQTVTLIYVLFVLAIWGFYLFFLRKKYLSRFLIGGLVLILLFSYPAMLSSDIFNYLTTAKVLFTYHENPYIAMPIEFTADPNLLFTHAANKIALYGPLWIALSAVPYYLGFGNVLLTLLNFKILAVLFYLGLIWIIRKLTKSDLSIILFALNPLVIIETLVGNHNDVVMMFLALFAFLLLKRKKILLACLFLISSILIKYATVFLLPIFIVSAYKIYKGEKVDWDKIYLYSWFLIIVIFFLSALRVEIYPWYAIWFLVFAFLIPQNKIVLYSSLALSFGLLFRYVPFMLLGTHFGITQIFKSTVTFLPLFLVVIYVYFKRYFK